MSRRPRILVVEDNTDIREALGLWLETEGYAADLASDGIEALEVLETESLPDLILLDMLMPRMNGWELVNRLKRHPDSAIAKIPVIAVTATSDKLQQSAGFQGVVRKPFDLDTLAELLERFFSKDGPPNHDGESGGASASS